jgi:hypothetical protein
MATKTVRKNKNKTADAVRKHSCFVDCTNFNPPSHLYAWKRLLPSGAGLSVILSTDHDAICIWWTGPLTREDRKSLRGWAPWEEGGALTSEKTTVIWNMAYAQSQK